MLITPEDCKRLHEKELPHITVGSMTATEIVHQTLFRLQMKEENEELQQQPWKWQPHQDIW